MDAPVRPCSDFDIYMHEMARTEGFRRSVAMEVMGDGPFSAKDEKVEGVDLLEESWFFGNLLEGRKMMSRCFSDTCASSAFCQEMMVRNSYPSDRCPAPSVEPGAESKGANQEERPGSGKMKSAPKPARNPLLIAPSLPPSFGSKEGEVLVMKKDFEVQADLHSSPPMPTCVGREGRGSRLRRTTSLSPSDLLPPPQHTSKGLARSYSTSRHRPPPRRHEVGSMSMDVAKEMRRRYLNQNKAMRKSMSDLEYEELQGFKDLGFTFEKEDLTPSVVNILPGLQDKDRGVGGGGGGGGDQTEEDSTTLRKPYLSEAWLEQCSPPPIPNWVGNRSEQDIKAQIKFWARAVASNVR